MKHGIYISVDEISILWIMFVWLDLFFWFDILIRQP